jgi:hypothetical protein
VHSAEPRSLHSLAEVVHVQCETKTLSRWAIGHPISVRAQSQAAGSAGSRRRLIELMQYR